MMRLMSYTLVTFHAHPDDEALLTAGVMAKAAAAGHRVVLVVATAGEVGDAADAYKQSGDLGRARRAELLRSAEILGVARVELLGYRDSGLDHDQPGGLPADAPADAFARADVEDAAARLAAILVEESADVLTTYDHHGGYGHPDHLQVHRVGARAATLARTPVVLEATINRDLMQMGVGIAQSLGYEVPDSFNPTTLEDWFVPGSDITHAIDVSAYLDLKRSSMEAHQSQTTSGQDGDRSLALFLSLPPEYYAMAFGTEWFIEHGQPTEPKADDIFATLRR
jgi:LmbE family N-acetylglucosaminyl deacetylase